MILIGGNGFGFKFMGDIKGLKIETFETLSVGKIVVHSLKIEKQYYDDILHNEKRFEIRRNDRGFKVGDILELKPNRWVLSMN